MSESHLSTDNGANNLSALQDNQPQEVVSIEKQKQEQQYQVDVNYMLTSDNHKALEHRIEPDSTNPWISGSFYLIVTIVVLPLLAVIGANVSWHVFISILIGGSLMIAVIGILQLRNDKNLSEDNFNKLMKESLKRLTLLRH